MTGARLRKKHLPRQNEPPTAILVAVPLYRSPELLPPLTGALLEIAPELRRLNATILLVNDSPDDEALAVAIEIALARLRGIVAVEIWENPANIGFLASANRALEAGLATDRDVILLNSDALPRPGAFSEMLAAAYLDPLIAVVSPRSDNATICNSPVADELRQQGRDETYRAHQRIERHLPRITYVPTAVGFCLLIKRLALAELGLFDPIYGAGYNEENDFIQRCQQHGYRAALANHAYVHHIGEVSFAKTETTRTERDRHNHAILVSRYPEYDRAIARYFGSSDYRAEHVLGGLVPVDGRLGLLFDCRQADFASGGRLQQAHALFAAFADRFSGRFALRVLCSEEEFRFHGLHEVAGLQRWDEEEASRRPSAAVFRVGRPDPGALAALPHYGAITGVSMLGTSPVDDFSSDDAALHELWSMAARNLDLIGFDSDHASESFALCYPVPKRAIRFVSRCSTDWDTAASQLASVIEEGINRFDMGICRRHIAAAATYAEAQAVEAHRFSIRGLEASLDFAGRERERLEAQARELTSLLGDATRREEQAIHARQQADAAERDARLHSAEASRRAIEAGIAERLALDAQGDAQKVANDTRVSLARAIQSAEEIQDRENTLFEALAQPPLGRMESEREGLADRIIDWLALHSKPRRTTANPAPDHACYSGLRLVMMDDAASHEARIALLRWLCLVRLGGVLHLECSGEAFELKAFRALLALAGFTSLAHREGAGRLVMHARKTRDWPAFIVAAPARVFVEFAYRYWLRRPPTSLDCSNIDRQLNEGVSRNDALIGIAASQECWDYWSERLP